MGKNQMIADLSDLFDIEPGKLFIALKATVDGYRSLDWNGKNLNFNGSPPGTAKLNTTNGDNFTFTTSDTGYPVDSLQLTITGNTSDTAAVEVKVSGLHYLADIYLLTEGRHQIPIKGTMSGVSVKVTAAGASDANPVQVSIAARGLEPGESLKMAGLEPGDIKRAADLQTGRQTVRGLVASGNSPAEVARAAALAARGGEMVNLDELDEEERAAVRAVRERKGKGRLKGMGLKPWLR